MHQLLYLTQYWSSRLWGNWKIMNPGWSLDNLLKWLPLLWIMRSNVITIIKLILLLKRPEVNRILYKRRFLTACKGPTDPWISTVLIVIAILIRISLLSFFSGSRPNFEWRYFWAKMRIAALSAHARIGHTTENTITSRLKVDSERLRMLKPSANTITGSRYL